MLDGDGAKPGTEATAVPVAASAATLAIARTPTLSQRGQRAAFSPDSRSERYGVQYASERTSIRRHNQ